MKKTIVMLLCLLLTCACAPVEATVAQPEPTVAPSEPVAAPTLPAGESYTRLTEEGHALWLPADMEFIEGDEESVAAGFVWSAVNDLLDVTYRQDADDGLTLELYAQLLCAQEGFTAESLRIGEIDCVKLTPLDTDEGFCALLWRAHEGEIQQLQFTYALDTDDGFDLAEKVIGTLTLAP